MPPENRFSLKKIIIPGIIILIIAFFLGMWWVGKSRERAGDESVTTRNLFPFGNNSNNQANPTGAGNNPDGAIDPSSQGQIGTTQSVALRKITNYPVTGFHAFLENKTIREPKLDESSGETIFVSRTIPINKVRFNAKRNGIIADAELTPDTLMLTQKTQTEIPVVEEVWFGNKGNSIIFRSWNEENEEISTLLGIFPPQSSGGDYCAIPFTNTFKTGSSGTGVTELQKYLAQKLGTQAGVIINGYYGPKTTTFVTQAQKLLKVPETGVVDEATRTAINTDCDAMITAQEAETSQPISLQSSFLPSNILRGTAAPDTNQFFYLRKNATGVVGITTGASGEGAKTIFNSPFTEWRPQWINPTTLTMTTLASGEATGYMYTLTTGGVFAKVLGPFPGLTTLTNSTGTTTLYSVSGGNTLKTYVYDIPSSKTTLLDLTTLPEKCVWETNTSLICAVPKAITPLLYPDSWYQGLVSFNDQFWRIDTSSGSTGALFTPSEAVDGVSLGISPDLSYLYFINKIDGHLWSYRLK